MALVYITGYIILAIIVGITIFRIIKNKPIKTIFVKCLFLIIILFAILLLVETNRTEKEIIKNNILLENVD